MGRVLLGSCKNAVRSGGQLQPVAFAVGIFGVLNLRLRAVPGLSGNIFCTDFERRNGLTRIAE
jgi:hypothetical protein